MIGEPPSARGAAAGIPGPAAAEGLGRRIARGALWSVSARIAIKLIGVVSLVILARLLDPADFGLVAVATAFIGLVQILSEFSFDLALIRDQKAGRAEYDTVWTLSIMRGAALAALLALASGLVADFFGDARLQPIVAALAAGVFMEGFANVNVVDFRKDLQFHKDFNFLLGVRVVSFAVTVGLAFAWRDYRALVAGILAASLARLALSYAMHPTRPRLTLAAWRPIVQFTKWLLAANILNYLGQRSDAFVIGRLRGPELLGVYTVANEIAGLVSSELIAPLYRVLNPGFSKIAHDAEALRRAFGKVLSVAVLLTAPASIGIGVVAEPLVHVFLGPKWTAAIPLIQVLVVGHAISLAFSPVYTIYVATGRVQVIARGTLVYLSILLPGMIAGVWYLGAIGAAYALVAAVVVLVAANVWWIRGVAGIGAGAFAAALWRPAAATAGMAAAVAALDGLWAPVEGAALAAKLAALVAAGAIVYPLLVAALWALAGRPDGGERALLELAREHVPARLGRRPGSAA